METHFYGQTLGEFLRAEQAESAPGGSPKGSWRVAGLMLLSVAAAMALTLDTAPAVGAEPMASERPPALADTSPPVIPVEGGTPKEPRGAPETATAG